LDTDDWFDLWPELTEGLVTWLYKERASLLERLERPAIDVPVLSAERGGGAFISMPRP
jgi:hypothetical protein